MENKRAGLGVWSGERKAGIVHVVVNSSLPWEKKFSAVNKAQA